MGFGGWAAAAGDLLLGAECPACRRPGWGLCPPCRRSLLGRTCYRTSPDPCPAGFPDTATSSPYDAVMQQLVSAHKEHQVLSLTPVLATRLRAALDCLLTDLASSPTPWPPGVQITVVPVPSSPATVRARGFDATWALARRVAASPTAVRASDGPSLRAQRLLGLSRRVQDQAGLSARARRDNLTGSFRVLRRPPAATLVVLVDDVVTTGSSLVEASRALRAERIPVLGAATIAATVRSRPSDHRLAEETR